MHRIENPLPGSHAAPHAARAAYCSPTRRPVWDHRQREASPADIVVDPSPGGIPDWSDRGREARQVAGRVAWYRLAIAILSQLALDAVYDSLRHFGDRRTADYDELARELPWGPAARAIPMRAPVIAAGPVRWRHARGATRWSDHAGGRSHADASAWRAHGKPFARRTGLTRRRVRPRSTAQRHEGRQDDEIY